MQLTEKEIRQILIEEKRRKKQKQRHRRRIITFLSIIFCLFLCVGLYKNRDVLKAPLLDRGIIYINPGHGGVDPGSEIKSRKEKDDTLRLSLQIKKELNTKGFKVFMSRDHDVSVNKKALGKNANSKNADLMVSIHRNKAEDTSARGIEIWIPSDDDEISHYMGKTILHNLKKIGFEDRGVRPGTLVDPKDNYYDNEAENIPSCLIEVGFISNKKDNILFDKHLKENAKAIADGIEKTYEEYFESES